MEKIHLIFHISMLRKFVSNLGKVLSKPDVEIFEDLTYVKQPIWIAGTQAES